jgi:hypothetical protein
LKRESNPNRDERQEDFFPADSAASWTLRTRTLRLEGHIPVMFYTDHVAYGFIPDQVQIEKIKSQQYKIAILDTGDLPDYLYRDTSLVIIRINSAYLRQP